MEGQPASPERAEAWVSRSQDGFSVLVVCPCGEQLEAESDGYYFLHCDRCSAFYQFWVSAEARDALRGGQRVVGLKVWVGRRAP